MSNTKKPPTLHIFQSGDHTPMGAKKSLSFSDDDLSATINAYDPALHEAPLVKGHPKGNGPAFGWVDALSAENGIEATTRQVEAQFAEDVNDGRFKKISSSFYRPDSPFNPVPGVYYLRHVGFFGDTPVAVKGGRDAAFSEADLDTVSFKSGETADDYIEFSEELNFSDGAWSISSLFRSLREAWIEKHGKDEADKVLPAHAVENLEDVARHPKQDKDVASEFSESKNKPKQPNPQEHTVPDEQDEADFAEKQTKLENDQKAFSKQQKDFADKQLKQLHDENVSFCEERVGKMPGQVEVATALLDQLSNDDSEDFSDFAEGDDKSLSPRGALMQFIDGLGDKVNFGEVIGDEDEAAQSLDFASPEGYDVDADQVKLYNKATAYASKNDVDFSTAVKAVGGK